MNTRNDIIQRIGAATEQGDVGALRSLIDELRAHDMPADGALIANVRGIIALREGDHAVALARFEEAASLYAQLADDEGRSRALANTGIAYRAIGDYARALAVYQEALTLNEVRGDRASIGICQANMGQLYVACGEPERAHACFRTAADIFNTLGHRVGAASIAISLGTLAASAGEYQEAIASYERALQLYTSLEHRSGMVLAMTNIVNTHLEAGDIVSATPLIDRLRNEQITEPRVRCAVLNAIGRAHELTDDLAEAATAYRSFLEEAERHHARDLQAAAHTSLRDLAYKQRDLDAYVEHNRALSAINDEIRGQEVTRRMAQLDAQRIIEGERREREKERALLYSALPRQIADRMISGERITGDHIPSACVMFADIVGFTTHSATMHESDVVALLATLYQTFDALADTYEVVKIKTIGDSYMCFKGDGAPASNASAMASMASAMISRQYAWPDGTPLHLRIGMHSGPVSAGVIGTQRLQYDVWGDTVNVASRMESTGEPDRIHVSEAFAQCLTDAPLPEHHLTSRGMVDVKGKGAMMTYWLDTVMPPPYLTA